jgi:anti-anti-sigma factor
MARPKVLGVAVFRVDPLEGGQGARLIGELDLAQYQRTDQAFSTLFHADGDVILDLAELTFIDSSGIRLLIRLHAAVAERGGRVIVRDPAPHVARVLEVAGLLDLGIVVETSDA